MRGNEQTHCMALHVLHVVSFHFLMDRTSFEQPCRTLQPGERLQGLQARQLLQILSKAVLKQRSRTSLQYYFTHSHAKGNQRMLLRHGTIRYTDFKCNTSFFIPKNYSKFTLAVIDCNNINAVQLLPANQTERERRGGRETYTHDCKDMAIKLLELRG